MRGFSLVELSIVLVILGLLTGGILTGQSLIRAAELRSVTTEYSRWVTATQAFRDKYLSLPGDMPDATAFWFRDETNCASHTGTAGTPGTCNGNGDGRLADAASESVTGESFRYWQQLALAGLIEGVYSGLSGSGGGLDADIRRNVPASKLANAGWSIRYMGTQSGTGASYYYPREYGHILYFGRETSSAETADDTLKPEEAWNIDIKLDDGKPNTGKVSSFKRGNGYTANCVSAETQYALTLTSVECSLLFSER